MKLSTRTRYGMRAILELAENYSKDSLTLKTIARRQDISLKYLEQLMATLKTAGIVRSQRGPKGGYVLAKPPERIKISDCFICLEGRIIMPECVDNESYCVRTNNCAARKIWQEVQIAIMEVLQSMTLQNAVDLSRHDQDLDYQI